jgi:hypothetical protein
MPTLQGLTRLEKSMCDLLWNMDTPEQIHSFRSSLRGNQRDVFDRMLMMITIECIDEEVGSYDDCEQARDILSGY